MSTNLPSARVELTDGAIATKQWYDYFNNLQLTIANLAANGGSSSGETPTNAQLNALISLLQTQLNVIQTSVNAINGLLNFTIQRVGYNPNLIPRTRADGHLDETFIVPSSLNTVLLGTIINLPSNWNLLLADDLAILGDIEVFGDIITVLS